MTPEEAEIARKYAGKAGETFQPVSQPPQPELSPDERARRINQELKKNQFLSQESYFNPDRMLEYGRRDAGPTEVELFDTDTRMPVARVARNPQDQGNKQIFWKSSSYNPDLEYQSITKDGYVSLIDPQTNREVARSDLGGYLGSQAEVDDPDRRGPENPFDGLSYVDLEKALQEKRQALERNEKNQSTNPRIGLLPAFQKNLAELRTQIAQLEDSRDRLLNDPEAKLIFEDLDALIDQEIDYQLREGKPISGDTGPDHQVYEKLQAYLETESTEIPNLFSNPRLTGAIHARYEVLHKQYKQEFPEQLTTADTTTTSETPPSKPSEPTTPPAPTPDTTEDSSSSQKTPNYRELQDQISALESIKKHTPLNPEQVTKLSELQSQQLSLIENIKQSGGEYDINSGFQLAESYAQSEFDHYLANGEDLNLPDYITDRNRVIHGFLSKYPQLDGLLMEHYKQALDSKKNDPANAQKIAQAKEKARKKQASVFENITYIYDEQLSGPNATDYVESQIEDFENSGDDTILKAINNRIDQIKAGNRELKERFDVELLNSLKYYVESRIQLYNAQKNIPFEANNLTEDQLKGWGTQAELLLLNRGEYYLKTLIKGIEKKDGTRIQPLALFNAAEEALWSETISQIGEVELADKTKVTEVLTYNYFQFPGFTPDASNKLNEYYAMKTLLTQKIWNEISVRLTRQYGSVDNQQIRAAVRNEISLGYQGSNLYRRLFQEYFNTPPSGDHRLATPKSEDSLSETDQIELYKAKAALKVTERLYRAFHIGSVLRGPVYTTEEAAKKSGLPLDQVEYNFAARLATRSLRQPKAEILKRSKLNDKLAGIPASVRNYWEDRLRSRILVDQKTANRPGDDLVLIEGEVDRFNEDWRKLDLSKQSYDFISTGRTPQFIARMFFEPIDRIQSHFGSASKLRRIPYRRQDFFSMVADETNLPLDQSITSFEEAMDRISQVKSANAISGWISSFKDAAKSRDFVGTNPQNGILNRLFTKAEWEEVNTEGRTYLAKIRSNESRFEKDAAGRKYYAKMSTRVNKLIEDALQTYNFGTVTDKAVNLIWLEQILSQFLLTEECKKILQDEAGIGYHFEPNSHGYWAFRHAFYTNPNIAPTSDEAIAYINNIKAELEKRRPDHMRRSPNEYAAKQRAATIEKATKGSKGILEGIGSLFGGK